MRMSFKSLPYSSSTLDCAKTKLYPHEMMKISDNKNISLFNLSLPFMFLAFASNEGVRWTSHCHTGNHRCKMSRKRQKDFS